jgi:hypothetical protein
MICQKGFFVQKKVPPHCKDTEKELWGLSPVFHIHGSVSDLYIPTFGLPILLQENMWTNPGSI